MRARPGCRLRGSGILFIAEPQRSFFRLFSSGSTPVPHLPAARPPKPKKLSPGLVVLACLAGLGLLLLGSGGAWLRSWLVYPYLSEQERIETFNDAVVGYSPGGVAARLERGGLTVLSRSDIAQVGASKCTRESTCAESSRRICKFVSVTFYCAYAVTDTAGNAATAIVKANSNPKYEVGTNIPGSPKWLLTENLSSRDATEKLCEFGFGCQPATGAGAVSSSGAPASAAPAAPARSADAAPPSPARETTDCKGIRADVVGKGETCLDPGDPARREFVDCNKGFCGPTMVALPKGSGVRGSSPADVARLLKNDPPARPDRFQEETPQRAVTIAYQLAVGKFEVTAAAWTACVADGGCTRRLTDHGGRPATGMSWDDITNQYLPWLNRKLGLSGANAYRLLTETEWEYAARAGTTTQYAFGDIISTAQAAFFHMDDPVDVGSFAPNAFGLHDMHGNAAEWVQDCFEAGAYQTAPVDGAAHRPRDCSNRSVRGGSWTEHPKALRSASRYHNLPNDPLANGFRVARTLGVR